MYRRRWFSGFFNKDFAWKVNRRMQYDKNPLFIILLDKYKVKEFARSKGAQTARLFYVTDQPETIPFNKLPSSYFIKANHASGWNILCYNSKHFLFDNGENIVNSDGTLNKHTSDEYSLSKEECVYLCKRWLGQKYKKREWAYQYITPKIIIEEVLESEDNGELKDYRMYTFHGKVKAINVGSPQYRKNKENVFFDHTWREFNLTKNRERRPCPLPKKPDNLTQMIDTAEILVQELDFARVDLYNTTKGIVLGEITIYPESGSRETPTTCRDFNKWLGEQWGNVTTNHSFPTKM